MKIALNPVRKLYEINKKTIRFSYYKTKELHPWFWYNMYRNKGVFNLCAEKEMSVMKKKRVLILFGGYSSEYEVSLQSAYSVIVNMNSDKYETILIGITREGNWVRYYGDIAKIPTNTWYKNEDYCIPVVISPDRNTHKIIEFSDKYDKDKHIKIQSNENIEVKCIKNSHIKEGLVKETEFDIAFPIFHGKNGEDGTVQGLLELAGIPFVGCDTLSSALCMDKDKAHKLVEQAGIKTPASFAFSMPYKLDEIIEQARHISYPLFVKPVKAGSSFGITKVFEEEKLQEAVENAFLYDDQVIIEENIDGFEVGCAVLGNDELIIGEVDEIELMVEGGFFDYVEKYNLISSKIHMPARIDRETTMRIKETAAIIYRTLGCRGFARVDMFLTSCKEIVFNEVNTIPGFTSHSRYPNMMKGIGLQFANIIDKLIQLGLEK